MGVGALLAAPNRCAAPSCSCLFTLPFMPAALLRFGRVGAERRGRSYILNSDSLTGWLTRIF